MSQTTVNAIALVLQGIAMGALTATVLIQIKRLNTLSEELFSQRKRIDLLSLLDDEEKYAR